MVGPRAARLGVLYVSASYTPHDRRFLAAIAGRAKRATWLRLSPGAGPETRPLPPGVDALPDALPPESDVAGRADAVRRAIESVHADVVLAGPVPTGAHLAVLAQAAPVIAMAWGTDVLTLDRATPDLRARGEAALRGAAGFLGDAVCVARAAAAHGLRAGVPLAVFPWGLDDEAFLPRVEPSPLRQALGWTDAHVLVSLRGWHRDYRIDVLLDGFARASANDPRLRLLLVGDGDDAPRIRERARALGDRVHLPGHVRADDTRRFLDAADLYVSTVPSDGSSISLLESMAASLPSVVVGAFGNLEWVEEGKTGWLVPAGDPDALARAIHAAFEDPARRRRMGADALEVAERRARWGDGVEQLVDLLEAVE